MSSPDRDTVAEIVHQVGNFSRAEIDCALELIDIYLKDSTQRDYRVEVAEDSSGRVRGFVCWGPTPMTLGTYDLYWIATHPAVQGLGFGRSLAAHVESRIAGEKGRLLIVETSSKESYGKTVGFYRRLRYEEACIISDFYAPGDDKLVFVKRFPR